MELKTRELQTFDHQVYEAVTIRPVSVKLKKMLSQLENPVIHPYYKISEEGIWAKELYAWDGVTGSVDSEYLRVPSLVHDIGCQAVNNRVLPREFRAAFDREYFVQSLLYNPYPKGSFLNQCVKVRSFFEYVMVRLWGLIPKGKEKDKYSIIHRITLKS